MLSDVVNQLYTTQNLDPLQPVPEDIKSVWLIGPNKPLDKVVIDNLSAFLMKGGTLGLLVDKYNVVVNEFRTSPVSLGLEPILDLAGLSIQTGLIADQRCDRIQVRASQGAFQMINVVDYPFIPVLVDVNKSHPATKGIDAFTMGYCSPIDIHEQKPGLTYTTLARTSNLSYLETVPYSVNPLHERYQQPTAPVGPFNVAMIVEGKFNPMTGPDSKPGRLILFSSSRFIRSEFPLKQSNLSLFVNLMDWAVQDEVLLQIRSKGLAQKPLKPLSDGIRIFIKVILITAMPLFSMLIGFIVWQKQKMRRALMPLVYKEAV